MRHPAAQYIIAAAEGKGWQGVNYGEAKVALVLDQLGYAATDVQTQFRLGRWRLDFAFPAWRVAIESDGWVHTSKGARERDKLRDAELSGWGWQIIRLDIDEELEPAVIEEQIFQAKANNAADAAAFWGAIIIEDRARRNGVAT